MNTYKIEIRELYAKIIDVEAVSSEEALKKIEEAYRSKTICLTQNDYIATEIDECTDEDCSCSSPFNH